VVNRFPDLLGRLGNRFLFLWIASARTPVVKKKDTAYDETHQNH